MAAGSGMLMSMFMLLCSSSPWAVARGSNRPSRNALATVRRAREGRPIDGRGIAGGEGAAVKRA